MGIEASKQVDTVKEVVAFTIGEKLHRVRASSDITPETSLNTYLRTHAGLRGTKAMCYEGGCGSCVVAVTIRHPIMKKNRTIAVNSCLIPILSCHGWTINTIEGIGNRKIGYHPVQEVLAKFNGTQCGYCSGGMVMNMYALYTSKEMLTMQDVENGFSGNICRCTGYRPIMDAFKSLAADADPEILKKCPDIEDLRICAKTKKECSGKCESHPLEEKKICMVFDDNNNWYKVYSIVDILELFQNMGDASYRFVAGNTGQGVYKIENKPEFWIDVLAVPDLISYKIDSNLILGANMSLTDTMMIMETLSQENSNFWHLKKVKDHLDIVANVPVRNAGTLAGNLSLKYEHHEFPSDIYLLLDTIKANVTIVKMDNSDVTIGLTEYLALDMKKCVIKSIIIPPLSKDKYLFESYKICPRVQNAHAYVNAGFLVEHDNYVVKSARLLFGGIDPEFFHAKNTEQYLVGKNLAENATLQGVLEKLNEEIKPNHILPDAAPEFRKNLALSLFYKFVLASIPSNKISSKHLTGGTRLKRELSSGKQVFDTNKNLYPLTEPVQKLEALIQCAGEAQYVNDMPAIPEELFGALVLAEAKPMSKIKSVDVSEALKMPGVRAYVDHKDIPGVNNFSPPDLSPTEEQLFCVDKVRYNGQPIGLILANTHEQANDAVKMVKITFEETKDIPSYTLDDVFKNKQMERIKNLIDIHSKKKGDKTKHVIKGMVKTNQQYHFTMETQNCICIPTDDGGMDIYPATQWMHHVQASAARALNMPMNKINVSVKRLGGAYGSKIVRSSLVSTACAVAAFKMNKPVRIMLPLIENMKALGKRVQTHFDYEAGVDENGVVQYMKLEYYQAVGTSGYNECPVTHVPLFIGNSYNTDIWDIKGNMVHTDLPGNAFCRAPGSTEAVAAIESIMDHIAYSLKKDPLDIRRANIVSDNKPMHDLLKDTLAKTDYEKRMKAVNEFNSKNRWMKKGISLVVMEYQFVILAPYSVFVSVYGLDGTVSISHGGSECGQGINTKVAQVCAHTLKIPLNMVSIKPSTTMNAPNNFTTGGSMTSEAVCYGTIQACNELLRRLEPVKEKMNNPTWKELVHQGFKEQVELCATYMFTPQSGPKPYLIHGTCVCEVTCDILTGEHNIDRVDLYEDAGQSMSPSVDIGQMEGAFVMGLGYHTLENLIYDDQGKLLTNSTWTYKVPGVKDIPADFRINFKQNSSNPNGVLNSKSTGEPPLCMSVSIPLAIRRALASARMDADDKADPYVPMHGPTTVEFKFQNSLNDYKKYIL